MTHWHSLALGFACIFASQADAWGTEAEHRFSLQLASSQATPSRVQPHPHAPHLRRYDERATAANTPKFDDDISQPTSRRTAVESMLASLDEINVPKEAVPPQTLSEPIDSSLMPSWESWTSPERLVGSIRVVAIMAALSLAPALLLMTTCYVRLVVVLGLLRQALGSQQLPPQQVTTTLAMFLTALIMWPVWSQVHDEAIEPYSNPEVEMSAEEAWANGVRPIRKFMIEQIRRAGNGPDVAMFLDYLQVTDVESNAQIPLQALLPAFLISELKVAFLIGFQIYLPFVLLELVVASVTMSMGMVMVPPTTISLPLKLIMFVLVDGWHLVVEMLVKSFMTG